MKLKMLSSPSPLFYKAFIATAGLFLVSQAFATVITGDLLPKAHGSLFSSIAVDPVTGNAYMSNGYLTSGVRTFANTAALESNTVSSNVATHNPSTYLAAYNGSLYMHTGSPTSLQISKISATTGAVEASKNVAGGMGTSNGAGAFPPGVDSFNWGGYSVLNPMSDGSKLYVVSGMAGSSKWGIATFDYALNQEKVVSFDLLDGTAGFAFAINGFIYFGDWYNSHHISRRVEAATGAVQKVDVTLALAGFGPGDFSTYITGITYDSLHDTLYTSYQHDGRVVKTANIAGQLGIDRAEVPEPTSIALLGLGLAALGGAIHRRKSHV